MFLNIGIYSSNNIQRIVLNVLKIGDVDFKIKWRRYSKNSSIFNYCLENVRKNDHENFLAVLLLPKDVRDSVFAIRAFNIELAQVKDVTSQELIGRMRLQFWRESLDNIYNGKPPNQPIAKALYSAKLKHNLSKMWLKNLIDSREDGLVDKLYPNIEAIEDYAEKSNSSLYYLTLQCIGVENINADHVASHMGKSEGIVKLLRSIPILSRKRVVTVPVNLLALHRVSQEDIIRGIREQKMRDLIYDMSSVAFQHLHHAKELENEVPKKARIGFLPAVGVSVFLRNLQLANFDIFDPNLQKRNSSLPFKLYWSKIKNSYR